MLQQRIRVINEQTRSHPYFPIPIPIPIKQQTFSHYLKNEIIDPSQSSPPSNPFLLKLHNRIIRS